MKQISIAANVILIAVIFYLLYNRPSDNNNNEPGNIDTSHCTSCKNPFNGITANEFIDVVARYRTTRYEIINPDARDEMGKDFKDSRCVWFSLDTLKKFICYIERYSDEISLATDSLGIRFYYAVYPGTETDDFGPEYTSRLGQHTLFMVPTTRLEGEDLDFDPFATLTRRRETGSTSGMMYLDDVLSSPNYTKPLLILGATSRPSRETSAEAYAWNNGRLCPTNCPRLHNTLTVIDDVRREPVSYR